jgi:COMPASS component SPP1
MCRYDGCNKPARADTNPPSKYCSDAHKKKWATEMVTKMPDGPRQSRGGALTKGELRAVLEQTKGDVKKFHALGAKPELPTSRPIDWNTVLTNEEKGRVCEIEIQRIELDRRSQGFKDRERFIRMIFERVRGLADENKELVGICGYDTRLSFNEEEFAAWRNSPAGKKAFETGKLEDGTSCEKKKCLKHQQWLKVGIQDAKFEEAEVQKAIDKLRAEEHAIQRRANTREASKM